jgi:glycosyltransferase involved in cell wall biosynthesis
MAKEKINVMHICDHLGWEGSRMHGVKRLFAYIFPRHDRERFNLSLVSLRQRDLSEERLEDYGINIHYLGRHKFDPRTYGQLKKIVEQENAHILHMHGYGATTFGRLVGWRTGRANILHEHANLTNTPWFQKLPDWFLDKKTDICLAVGESTLEFAVKARKCNPEHTQLVYLGAPMEDFYPRKPEEVEENKRMLGLPTDRPIVGTVTRLHENKGNTYLVEAMPQVQREVPGAVLVIAGEGPLEEPLRAQATELGIADDVIFLGFQSDVPAVMSAFDVMVYPSLWEGTPLTCFEALGMGKALVSTKCDGLQQVLTDGETALMCEMRDPAGLADNIVKVLTDDELRKRLEKATLDLSPRYDIQNFVNRMEDLYEQLYEKHFGGGEK